MRYCAFDKVSASMEGWHAVIGQRFPKKINVLWLLWGCMMMDDFFFFVFDGRCFDSCHL